MATGKTETPITGTMPHRIQSHNLVKASKVFHRVSLDSFIFVRLEIITQSGKPCRSW